MKYTEPGEYELAYAATDSCGNVATAHRQVTVVTPSPKVVYASYDSSDNSFKVFKDDDGKYTHKQVIGTKTYYTGIETSTYANATAVPWFEHRTKITNVEIVDSFSPVSLNYFFCGFKYCVDSNGLAIQGLEKIDMSNCTTMKNTFGAIANSTLLDKDCDLTMLDTSNVTNMSGCFSGFFGTPIISNWNTEKVTDMNNMFADCMTTELDLSSFNTGNVNNMVAMFSSSEASVPVAPDETQYTQRSRLKTVYVSSSFDTSAVTNSVYMFTGCKVIVGGDGTTYDPNHVDKEYARVDNLPSTPGYFTEK